MRKYIVMAVCVLAVAQSNAATTAAKTKVAPKATRAGQASTVKAKKYRAATTTTTDLQTSTATKSTLNLPFALNIGVGVNSTTLDGLNTSGTNLNRTNRHGFTVSVMPELAVTSRFAMESGLVYESTGENLKTAESGVEVNSVTRLDYLSLPVLAKYYFTPTDSSFAAYARGGFKLGYLLSGSNETNASVGGNSQTITTDAKRNEDIYSFDPRTTVGVGFKTPLQSGQKIFGGLDYEHSISKINPNGNQDIYNQILEVTAGMTL